MDHFSDQAIERLLDDVYYAAASPQGWQAVVDRLGTMCDGGAVSLQGHDFVTNRHLGVLTSGFSQEAVVNFRDHYASVNPWVDGIARWPVGMTMFADKFIDRADLKKTEFYNDFLRPNDDIALGVGAVAHRSQLRFFALSVNLRMIDEERLYQKVGSLFDVLAPHLKRAFRVSDALEGSDLSVRGIERLEMASSPAYVLGTSGRVLFANAAARDPAGPAAPYIDSRSLRLTFVDPGANAGLAVALGRVSGRGEGFSAAETIRASAVGGERAASVTLVPFFPASRLDGLFDTLTAAERPAAVLFLVPPERLRRERCDRLMKLGLSEAEVQIVLGLSEGRSVEELAADRRRTVSTVRNQVRSAFSKLGVRRQGELVAKVLQLV